MAKPLPCMIDLPEQWRSALPPVIEVREGVPEHGKAVIAFRNRKTKEMRSILASEVDKTKPLPEFLQERIRAIA